MHNVQRNQGFSLIELSIVLAIVALVVASILIAQGFITNSRQTAIIKESQQYMQAVQNFKLQYRALPGDFIGAEARWDNVEATASGDGDGVLETNASGVNETQRAWQHLKLAGVLSDYPYTGDDTVELGTSVPESRGIELAGYQLMGNVSVFSVNRGNAMLFGKVNGANLTFGVMLAKHALTLDEKIDDMRPDSGMLLGVSGQENSPAGCTDREWNQAAPATYMLGDTTGLCYFVFLQPKDNF